MWPKGLNFSATNVPFSCLEMNTAGIIASFKVSHVFAKRMKPFEDSEVIQEAMTEAADVLYDCFYNNALIKSAIANF